ncbi:MAG: TerB family tellurite resistance protein [Coriobacteriia bacterium]|nr:TerB family tellurite resistance protein [Coriobacteriia bacterium]
MAAQIDTNTEGEKQDLRRTIQDKLAAGMMGVFELVISDRSAHFARHPDLIPDRTAVPSIIASYCTTNAAISGGASLVPGPWGMVAVVPEITAVIRNQLAMIYDVGMAYGKREALTKELLAGVLITAMGASAGSLLVMQGEKVLVKRVALRGFQRVIEMLAGRVTQQVLKSTISKWLPIVGAVAMAAWSNFLTRQVGRKAVEIFEKEIVLLDEVIEEIPVETDDAAQQETASVGHDHPVDIGSDMLRVQALLNLMRVDGTVRAEELDYVHAMIDSACLTQDQRDELTRALQTGAKFTVDYAAFASSPDDSIGLLVDLVALARRDGTFHVTEMMFVKRVGELLGFPQADIDEVMAASD